MARREPLLLTPGPLTTSEATKRAMLRDWGSRDHEFIALTARVLNRLTAIARAEESHVCVPLQGSGTYAVEAMLGTMIPKGGNSLVLINGAYGRRIAKILSLLERPYEVLETAENAVPDPGDVEARLVAEPTLQDVVMVHCETTSGILNPLEEIAAVVSAHGRRLIVDAMSSFGAIPVDLGRIPIDALAASSNKCLEGVPGIGFAMLRKTRLERCAGNSHSLVLDLHEQWQAFNNNGQWRFTPPTHVLAALDQALNELAAEGGVSGRFARYWENCRVLIDGMRDLGFETFLPDSIQAPIIVTFATPGDPAFEFDAFYDALAKRGYVIYPGKLTEAASFRVGCIGRIDAAAMESFLDAVGDTLKRMGLHITSPPLT